MLTRGRLHPCTRRNEDLLPFVCHRCHACTAYHNGVADTIGVSLQQCPWVINKERSVRQTQAHLAYDEPEPDARMESTSQHLGRSGFPGVKPRYPGRADYMGAANRPRSSASQQSKPGSANSSKRVIEDVIVAALENAGVKEVPAQDIGSLWDTLNADGSGTIDAQGMASFLTSPERRSSIGKASSPSRVSFYGRTNDMPDARYFSEKPFPTYAADESSRYEEERPFDQGRMLASGVMGLIESHKPKYIMPRGEGDEDLYAAPES